MSSMSFCGTRKRLRSPDFSDSDSDDDIPPFKLMKQSGPGFPFSFFLDIASDFSGKLKNLFLWISDLPVKSFFTMAIRSESNLGNETIVLDDDDEDDMEEEEENKSQKVQVHKMVDQTANLSSLIERIDNTQKPFSSNSAPPRRHSDLNVSISISQCYERSKVNGSSLRDWYPRCNENGSSFLSRQSITDNLKRPAIVSNPDTAIEILLDTKKDVPAPETDDIVIVSESPSTKQKHVSSHKSHRLSRLSALRHSTPVTHQSKNDASSVTRLQSSSPQNFTANEVVRLQEKAQYRLLLEKFINESYYHPATKKQNTKAEIQADNRLASSSHFTREVVQKPTTDFFERYCKPSGLLTPEYEYITKKKVPDDEENKEAAEVHPSYDEDEELKILEVIEPVKRSTLKWYSNRHFSSEWITDLKLSLSETTKEGLHIVAAQERALENFRKERLLSQIRIEPELDAVEEFPELTPEMEEAVDYALKPGPPDDPVRKNDLDYLVRKDMESLDGLNWLNDRVINAYFELIVERSKQEDYPSVHAFNTFFYGKLKQQGYDSIKRWTRKIDLFSFDLIFVPIHLGVHWCLAVIDNRSKKICYYDSMGTGEEQCLDLLHDYIMLEHQNKKGKPLDPSSYITESVKDIPQQMNGSDCGMFTVKYAEYISRDAEITFNQGHMQYFRRRMVYELAKGQLLNFSLN